MIYQQDIDFPDNVRHFGCYLLSLVERLTNHFDLPFTHDSVLSIYDYGRANLFIDEEVTILDPQVLCDFAVGRDKVRFVGHVTARYIPTEDEMEILCWHKAGASFNHFCSGNGKGIVLYDPWSASGSDSVRNGELISKRIYRIA